MDVELSVVAPCFNEQDNVHILFERLSRSLDRSGVQYEVVFVDDGSRDLTWERLRWLQELHPDRVVIKQHRVNQGIPAGWISGVGISRGRYVCLIDSDLQNPPESVALLLAEARKTGWDLVRGVRIPVGRELFHRKVMSRTLNWLLNRAFGMKSRDNKSGFLLGSKSQIEKIIQHSGTYRHFQTFIGVSAHFHSLKVVEVDTPFERRNSGESFLSGRSIGTIREVLRDLKVARTEFR